MTDHRADTGAIASAVHHVVIGCNEHDGDKTSSNHSHESIPLCCSRYFRTIRPLRHSNRDRRSHRRRQTERFEVRDLITLPRALLARALCVFKKRLRGSQKHRVRAQNLNCRSAGPHCGRFLPLPPEILSNRSEPGRPCPAALKTLEKSAFRRHERPMSDWTRQLALIGIGPVRGGKATKSILTKSTLIKSILIKSIR